MLAQLDNLIILQSIIDKTHFYVLVPSLTEQNTLLEDQL
jgi:hypothetical protein